MKYYFEIKLPPKGKDRPRVCGGRAHMPDDYTAWMTSFVIQCRMQAHKHGKIFPLKTHTRIFTDFYTVSGNTQSDVDNAHSACLDGLQKASIIINDKQNKGGGYLIGKSDSDYDWIHISVDEIHGTEYKPARKK